LAVAVADGAGFCYLAGKLRAFKTQFNFLIERTGRYLAEFIIPGNTTSFFTWAGSFNHSRAFFASNSTYAYFHFVTPVLSSTFDFANRTPAPILRQAVV
jgi:hypothetical protein